MEVGSVIDYYSEQSEEFRYIFKRMLKVDFKDLVFKNYSYIPEVKQTVDLDTNSYSLDDFSTNSKKKTLNYIVIFCEKKIGERIIKLQSSKIYEDLDTIKIYLNGGFVFIEHSSDFSTYRYNLNFLYQL